MNLPRFHAIRPTLFSLAFLLVLDSARSGETSAAPATERARALSLLTPMVRSTLDRLERHTGLEIEFQSLPPGHAVMAQYIFRPDRNRPVVMLRPDAQSVDVAHELVHMELELVDGFAVLAWKRGVDRTREIEAAFGRVRTYIDDEIVHARLVKAGFAADREVLRPPLFDDLYAKATALLESGRDRPDDGMAHLDASGYGDLCRCAFLVQAELILKNYRDRLPADRIDKTRRFVEAFRKHRGRESTQADRVLELFASNDVNTIEGHRAITEGWTRLAGLDRFVGLTAFRRDNGRYYLPWPKGE